MVTQKTGLSGGIRSGVYETRASSKLKPIYEPRRTKERPVRTCLSCIHKPISPRTEITHVIHFRKLGHAGCLGIICGAGIPRAFGELINRPFHGLRKLLGKGNHSREDYCLASQPIKGNERKFVPGQPKKAMFQYRAWGRSFPRGTARFPESPLSVSCGTT